MSDTNKGLPEPVLREQKLRSFGRINGRKLSKNQFDLMVHLLPKISIDVESEHINLDNNFSKPYNKYCLEIGFGGGEHLAAKAKSQGDTGFIGCEPYTNGVASLLRYIDQDELNNVRLLYGDVMVLIDKLSDNSLDQIYILFPDPWPKAKHHKKRIISKDMMLKLSRILKKGGRLLVATDHDDYAVWIEEHFQCNPNFMPVSEAVSYDDPDGWVKTRYQKKAEKEGRSSSYFNYVLKK